MFVWKWTNDGSYTASSAYRAFFIGMALLPGAKDMCTDRRKKKFLWLATWPCMDDCGRRREDIITRHGLQDMMFALCVIRTV